MQQEDYFILHVDEFDRLGGEERYRVEYCSDGLLRRTRLGKEAFLLYPPEEPQWKTASGYFLTPSQMSRGQRQSCMTFLTERLAECDKKEDALTYVFWLIALSVRR